MQKSLFQHWLKSVEALCMAIFADDTLYFSNKQSSQEQRPKGACKLHKRHLGISETLERETNIDSATMISSRLPITAAAVLTNTINGHVRLLETPSSCPASPRGVRRRAVTIVEPSSANLCKISMYSRASIANKCFGILTLGCKFPFFSRVREMAI